MSPLVLLGIAAVLAVLIMTGSWMSPELMFGTSVAFGGVFIAVMFLFAVYGPRMLQPSFDRMAEVLRRRLNRA